jgi:hypothetical protein
MKILYNITVKIESDAHDDWLQWMKSVHIPDVMATGFFISYKLTKLLGDDDEHGLTYAIQYIAPDIKQFLEYQKTYAPTLQKAHSDRYPNKYIAFRTLMEIVEEG